MAFKGRVYERSERVRVHRDWCPNTMWFELQFVGLGCVTARKGWISVQVRGAAKGAEPSLPLTINTYNPYSKAKHAMRPTSEVFADVICAAVAWCCPPSRTNAGCRCSAFRCVTSVHPARWDSTNPRSDSHLCFREQGPFRDRGRAALAPDPLQVVTRSAIQRTEGQLCQTKTQVAQQFAAGPCSCLYGLRNARV